MVVKKYCGTPLLACALCSDSVAPELTTPSCIMCQLMCTSMATSCLQPLVGCRLSLWCVLASLGTLTHACTHTCTHAHTHTETHTHTHTHKHTCSKWCLVVLHLCLSTHGTGWCVLVHVPALALITLRPHLLYITQCKFTLNNVKPEHYESKI